MVKHFLFSFINVVDYSQFIFIHINIRVSFSDPHSRQHKPDDEHVTAVAAAAFSIHSLEEAGLLNLHKMKESPKFSRTKSVRGKEGKTPRQPSHGEISTKRSLGQEPARTTESAFPVRRPSGISSPRPISPAAGFQNNKGGPIIQHKNDEALVWEKAKIERIQKRYEKIKSKILSWEIERKIQAKQQMERKKSEWDHKRAMEMQHYRNKIARIDMIAQGAITRLEDRKRKQESKAREKAKKIRKTGRVPSNVSASNLYRITQVMESDPKNLTLENRTDRKYHVGSKYFLPKLA
ncbi:Remorin, C-terminal [Spatholobus suberectus]|nr:Remorin, C-terminal [Spatholobus suberectus]